MTVSKMTDQLTFLCSFVVDSLYTLSSEGSWDQGVVLLLDLLLVLVYSGVGGEGLDWLVLLLSLAGWNIAISPLLLKWILHVLLLPLGSLNTIMWVGLAVGRVGRGLGRGEDLPLAAGVLLVEGLLGLVSLETLTIAHCNWNVFCK